VSLRAKAGLHFARSGGPITYHATVRARSKKLQLLVGGVGVFSDKKSGALIPAGRDRLGLD
jgi:hypothetical protein